MRVIGIVPARGGSKGVPRKNIRLLNGKPLLAYTAEAALRAARLERVILSTDDEEIASVGQSCGLDVPFMRPPELATDTAPSIEVVRHALLTMAEKGEVFDAVCLLQPTNPLRRSEDIDNCINLLESSGANSVVSVLPVPTEYNPHWVYWKNGSDRLTLANGSSEPIPRRQELPRAFHRDGTVYVTRCSTVLNDKSLYGACTAGYEMDPEFSANIDTESDWKAVERRINAERSTNETL